MTPPAIMTARRRSPSMVMMPVANITSIAISVARPDTGGRFACRSQLPSTTMQAKVMTPAAITQLP